MATFGGQENINLNINRSDTLEDSLSDKKNDAIK